MYVCSMLEKKYTQISNFSFLDSCSWKRSDRIGSTGFFFRSPPVDLERLKKETEKWEILSASKHPTNASRRRIRKTFPRNSGCLAYFINALWIFFIISCHAMHLVTSYTDFGSFFPLFSSWFVWSILGFKRADGNSAISNFPMKFSDTIIFQYYRKKVLLLEKGRNRRKKYRRC